VQDFAWNPRTNRREPSGEPYEKQDEGGEGGVSTDNAIYRQSQQYFATEVDPQTGALKILQSDSHKVQATAERATELHRSGMSIAAAVRRAVAEKPWEARSATPAGLSDEVIASRANQFFGPAPQTAPRPAMRPAQQAQGGGLPPAAMSKLKPGVITTFVDGSEWTIRNGQLVRIK
jgi:hypothetical protein